MSTSETSRLASSRRGPTDADSDRLSAPLHYTARAGLLAELSRQTYDSLYKALREAILNGIDAGATCVHLDFCAGEHSDEVHVLDDGDGMDMVGLQRSFMSLGGSSKYADPTKFGRIGIGSLALLTYAHEAVIETKQAGSSTLVEAHLFHPQSLDRAERGRALDEFPAGIATEKSFAGARTEHFTRIRLRGVTSEVRRVIDDPSEFYLMLDQLRRVLPLPWRDCRIFDALEREDSVLVSLLRSHSEEWSVPVTVRSRFHESMELTRRTFGDGPEESWNGKIQPLRKTMRVVRPGDRREIVVVGFLINQTKASPRWSGLTARVQNVAVEEHTFFDVTADPGFRKYIAGEVFLLGEIDTDRLININRTSFNRESSDFAVIRRFMSEEIEAFKRTFVSQPQRHKVTVRRILEDRRQFLDTVRRVASAADQHQAVRGERGLPSSGNGSLRGGDVKLVAELEAAGCLVVTDPTLVATRPYRISTPEGANQLQVEVGLALAEPNVTVAGRDYAIGFRQGSPSGPAVIVTNRPRRIVFNLGHRAVGMTAHPARAPFALALEMAYLLPDDERDLYERVLDHVSIL